ncbi:EfeM/EfeO family lipoprotein [Photobacterium piscicola]|uniref:EfeM/EfeO family lipoprotein n=1 Tax=Photobacterium piscicola TaxID=1378299 RepID=A0ABU6LIY6_9GAMM|nr:EfeM/EfeO family lipoprotein [Photobacterium piscicola]MEC6882156.1 EfeM/EfeO family lipoprotein [Photobacterium piscicola]MEC6899518.1 EfeM/EfeO family lipoprotein [Photobacterium piscicola]
MRNKASISIVYLMFGLFFSQNVIAKALRSPTQTGNEIIIAKGNIPTPEKYRKITTAYMAYAVKNIGNTILQLNSLKQNLKDSHVIKAQKAYIQAHQYYETVRLIIRLFGHTDRIINSRSSDFLDGVTDYRFKGFHLVEYLLFDQHNIKATLSAVDELLMNVNDIKRRLETEQVDIVKLIQSSSDFIEMILETKLAGKENIYSNSDLTDIAANVEGSKYIFDGIMLFVPHSTSMPIMKNYMKIIGIIESYKLNTNEYKHYNDLSLKDKAALFSVLTQQAYLLATLRATLNLDVYYKYEYLK